MQGVSFRAAMRRQARRHGVTGWVRNRDDGAVEFAAQGEPDAVRELLEWAAHGPSGARVDALDVQDTDPADAPPDFEVRY